MKLLDNIIVRLVLYYTGSLAFFLGLDLMFPIIPHYVALELERNATQSSLDLGESIRSTVPLSEGDFSLADFLNPESFILVTLALLGAFCLTVPVIWVYRWTHSGKRYNQVFAHTLLLVPTAIALVVFLVKGSLALAFSLAGIVAAVRFRTTLKESLDAVYMFITIGIGLAAGVQLMSVAFIASVFFNVIALFIWRTNCVAKPATISGWTIMPQGDPHRFLGGSSVLETPTTSAAGKNLKPFNAQLRIHTSQTDVAQHAAFAILDAYTSRWQVAGVSEQDDGSSIVEFDVRVKKSTSIEAFTQEMQETELESVGKVEILKLAPPAPKADPE